MVPFGSLSCWPSFFAVHRPIVPEYRRRVACGCVMGPGPASFSHPVIDVPVSRPAGDLPGNPRQTCITKDNAPSRSISHLLQGGRADRLVIQVRLRRRRHGDRHHPAGCGGDIPLDDAGQAEQINGPRTKLDGSRSAGV